MVRDKRDFLYYTYFVGRYEPYDEDDPTKFDKYQENTKELVWNIFDYDINKRKITVRNIFEYNWIFLQDLYKIKKKYTEFEPFAEHVRRALQYQFWARCEYETIISGFPPQSLKEQDLNDLMDKLKEMQKNSKYPEFQSVYPDIGPCYKMDVYTQIMLNWDRFIHYLWDNRKLIRKK